MKNHYKDAFKKQNDASEAEIAVKKGNCTLSNYSVKNIPDLFQFHSNHVI